VPPSPIAVRVTAATKAVAAAAVMTAVAAAAKAAATAAVIILTADSDIGRTVAPSEAPSLGNRKDTHWQAHRRRARLGREHPPLCTPSNTGSSVICIFCPTRAAFAASYEMCQTCLRKLRMLQLSMSSLH
jgi:hypothetical protein